MTGALPEPGAHGDDAGRVAAALGIERVDLLDLSVSLNPFAPDVGVRLAGHLEAVRSYPDPGPVTNALAGRMGVDPDRLLMTNGGSEAIALVAAHLGSGHIEDPEFGLYRRHLADVGPGRPRWRSNPRNPTGLLASPDEEAVVWDEAFYPLATGAWTRGDAERGSWVVGSLTKVLACPGLRLGYLIGPDPESVARLARAQPEWSVNSLAAAVLPELLDTVDLPGWAARIAHERERLAATLAQFGWTAPHADANWVLVHAPGLRRALIDQRVLVRDCASFGLAGMVRIAVPHPDHHDRLKSTLAAAEAVARSQAGPPAPTTTAPPATPLEIDAS